MKVFTDGASIADQLRPQRGADLLSALENWYVFIAGNITFSDSFVALQ